MLGAALEIVAVVSTAGRVLGAALEIVVVPVVQVM